MTVEEAIFCEKSYIGETNCIDCKYYRTNTCQSRESHKMSIKALEREQESGEWIEEDYWKPLPYDVESYKYDENYDEETHSEKVSHWYCPKCHYDMGESLPSGKYRYCFSCGLKIKRSDKA